MSKLTSLDYGFSVFINCPFDAGYKYLFDALVFAVYECGFIARCALEIRDGSQVRIDKVFNIISECRYGIHDISRTELDAESQLPRFNMPLELGIFLAAKYYGDERQREKVCLVLDREKYRYQKFCSDIAGQDIDAHDYKTQTVVTLVRNFLQNARSSSEKLFPSDSTHRERLIPSGSIVFERYECFLGDLPALCDSLSLNRQELIFSDYVTLCVEWLKAHPRLVLLSEF